MAGYIVNAFQIPNDLVDRLLLELSPNALKCYLVIVRKTIGWGKEFDAISASQFLALTGIRKTDTIWAAIRELKELGLIEDLSIPGRPTQFKVITQTHPDNGDTPKNGSPRSEGATPTPKKGTTLKRGIQNPSSSKPNKPTISSSSLSPQTFEDEEEGMMLADIIPLDPFSEIPEEGIDGLTKDQIVAGVERIVESRAGDKDSYRSTLIREIISGGGRTLQNIRRPLSTRSDRPRIGSNRGEPVLPPGVSIFDVIEEWTVHGVVS